MNGATILALIVVVAVLALAAYGTIRGRNDCCGNCSECTKCEGSHVKPIEPCHKE